jgi:hypothetical protein
MIQFGLRPVLTHAVKAGSALEMYQKYEGLKGCCSDNYLAYDLEVGGEGSLLTKEIKEPLGSIGEIAQRFLEELRYFFFKPGEFERFITKRIQIRFNTS